MYNNRKVVVVMPAYNAEKTLEKTYEEVMRQLFVDHVVIVDDASCDSTADIAVGLANTTFFRMSRNNGYGGNQKKCYELALAAGADIIIMVHPDYQYTPLLLPAMISLIGNGLYHCVVGSRILGGGALSGGMPLYKYVSNRVLTLLGNIMLSAKLSEYHSGYRAFSRTMLETLDLNNNSDDFVFDNEMLSQVIWTGATVAEVSCPTKYFPEASSINFQRSTIYGLKCLMTGLKFMCCRSGFFKSSMFPSAQRNILKPEYKVHE